MNKLLVMLAMMTIVSCTKEKTTKNSQSAMISVVKDNSEPSIPHPETEPVLDLYNFEKNPEKEAWFRYVIITDKRLNPVYSLRLKSGEDTRSTDVSDDVHHRDKLIKEFYNTVRNSVKQLRQRFPVDTGLSYSECFCTISTELRHLSCSNADEKTLIIYSDLQENSSVFDCYSEDNRKMLQEHPEEVARILSSRCPLPRNLKGIRVVVVYNPPDREADSRFLDMLSVYTLLLQPRGAEISAQAHTSSFEL